MQDSMIGVGNVPEQPRAMPSISPFDLLLMSAKKKDESDKSRVSMKSLKLKEIEKVMDAYRRGKKVADDYYKNTIQPKIQARDAAFRASKEYYQNKFPRLSETSHFCSRDIKTTVDWMIPNLCEPFIGSDDPVDIKGVNVDDDENAKKIQQLIKYQLMRKNSYPMFLDAIWRDALKLNYAVAKVFWKRDEKRTRYEFLMSKDDMRSIAILQEAELAGRAEVVSQKELKGASDLVVVAFDAIEVSANHPIVQYMSPSELRFTPDARTVQEAKFKAHRKIVSGDYLKRKEREGIYSNVEKAMEEFDGSAKYDEYDTNKNKDLLNIATKLQDDDKASQKFELYEAYVSVDYNNDGILEDLIVHAVGDTPIRIAENELGFAPFFVAYAEVDPVQVFNENESFSENLLQQQDLKTAIFKQIITNTAKNNAPRTYVNQNVDIDALISGDEYILVDDKNDPRASVFSGEQLAISPMAMQIVEYAQNEIEAQSGSTRYNQGLDSNSLNKTATGIQAIMGSAEKRMKHMARVFSETFVLPIMKYLILLNQKYLDDEQMFRLANENITIRKEDLDIDCDLVINVGLGAGTREAQINYLMILIGQLYPQLAQVGIVNENSWYEVVKDLLEKMGIANASNYLIDPNSQEGQQAKQQAQQAAQAQMQAQMQLEEMKHKFDVDKARQPRLSMNYEDLPAEAQAQVLGYLGMKVDPLQMKAREDFDYARRVYGSE